MFLGHSTSYIYAPRQVEGATVGLRRLLRPPAFDRPAPPDPRGGRRHVTVSLDPTRREPLVRHMNIKLT